jgi:opacity protein-like surface antigen
MMKSARIILITAFVFLSLGMNAQVFIGGNFNISQTGGKRNDGSLKPSEFDLNLSPQIGKFLSDKVAIGIGLDFGLNNTNSNQDVERIKKTTSFGVVPFLRYYALTTGKFSVFGQANAGFSFANSNTTLGGNNIEKTKSNSISLNLVPGVSYDISERLALETYINLFNIGVGQTSSTVNDNKETNNYFVIGGGLNDVVRIGNITIGAIYKF